MNRLLIGAGNKTNLLLQLLAEDFPRGVTLIDPTGDLARAAANIVPVEDTQRTLYLDPSDVEHPIGLNVLQGLPPDQHQPFTELLCSYFESMWPNGWGPQSNYIFSLCIRLLLITPDATLLGVLKLLTDTSYRTRCLARCKDPVVLAGWQFIDQLSAQDKRWYPGAIAPLMNKIGTLLMSPLIRNIIGQTHTTFSEKTNIIIANLDRAKIGDLTARLLGGLLIARSEGMVYAHDLGFFASDGLGSFLSQDRFAISVSFLDELPTRLRQQVLGIEEKYVFRTNKRDADELAFYMRVMNPRMLIELSEDEVRTIYGISVPDAPDSLRRLNAIRKRTRAAHSRPRKKVEKAINRFFTT